MNYDNMKLGIDKHSGLTARDQIKQQIRYLVASGGLVPGKPLPPSRDLAAMLKVNRNTTAAAYRELAAEGLLETRVGAGTFVREPSCAGDAVGLEGVFQNALESAARQGVGPGAFADYLMMRIASFPALIADSRVLVVDCNDEVIDEMSATLGRELGAATDSARIQALQAGDPAALGKVPGTDLAVTGFNHLTELETAVPELAGRVVGVMLSPDLRVLEEIARIPAGSSVGYCCVNQKSTETFFRQDVFSGGRELRRTLVGADSGPRLAEALAPCSVVLATNYVIDRVRNLVRPETRLIRVDIRMEPGFIGLIRDKLLERKLRNSDAGGAGRAASGGRHD